jgi:hypothetical protein
MSTFNYPGPGIVRDGFTACPGGSGGGNYAQVHFTYPLKEQTISLLRRRYDG